VLRAAEARHREAPERMIVNSRNNPGQLCWKALGLTGAGRDGISKTANGRSWTAVWLRRGTASA
jgi:hypothetical protein